MNQFDEHRELLFQLYAFLNCSYLPDQNIDISLHVFPSDDGRTNGHVMFDGRGAYSYAIMVFIDKGSSREELIRILLHEYGHIMHVETIREESGESAVQSLFESYDQERDQLKMKAEKEGWQPDKVQQAYKEIIFEKKADEFVENVYSTLVSRGGVFEWQKKI